MKLSNVVCLVVSVNLYGIFGSGLSSDPNVGARWLSILGWSSLLDEELEFELDSELWKVKSNFGLWLSSWPVRELRAFSVRS
jgi:hypothetical protein